MKEEENMAKDEVRKVVRVTGAGGIQLCSPLQGVCVFFV